MDEKKYQFLSLKFANTRQEPYPYQSRIHPLRSFPQRCFVKRDDELGFGISGSKIRKFRTLISNLKVNCIESAIIIGGGYSNNVLGLVQLLIENGITPILFLLGDKPCEVQGNHLLIRLLVSESAIHWIIKEQWSRVASYAMDLANELALKGKKVVVIPEGSAMPSAIPGTLSLALDIIRNEKEENIVFDHLFLDTGTGFQASITLLAYAWMEKSAAFTLVVMANERQDFEEKLNEYHVAFEKWLEEKMPFPKNYELLYPVTAKSFGSVNAKVIDSVSDMAQKEGILTDPIYSAKLFDTAKNELKSKPKLGKVLIVHSGGGLALCGFQSQLAKRFKDDHEK